MQYLYFNGKYHPADEAIISAEQLNHLFFQDRLKVIRNRIQFWPEHLELLRLHFQIFRIPIPEFLFHEGAELKKHIDRCLVKSKCFLGATVEISFFQQNDNSYYLIQIDPSKVADYSFDPNGIEVHLHKQLTKSDSAFSSLYLGSKQLWKLALAASPQDSVPIILNHQHALVESPGSNLFILREGALFTPHPNCGAYINPAKRLIQQIAYEQGLKFFEIEKLTEEDLATAEEVFLADDLNGIRPVRAFKMKRFFKKQTTDIFKSFQKKLVH